MKGIWETLGIPLQHEVKHSWHQDVANHNKTMNSKTEAGHEKWEWTWTALVMGVLLSQGVFLIIIVWGRCNSATH